MKNPRALSPEKGGDQRFPGALSRHPGSYSGSAPCYGKLRPRGGGGRGGCSGFSVRSFWVVLGPLRDLWL